MRRGEITHRVSATLASPRVHAAARVLPCSAPTAPTAPTAQGDVLLVGVGSVGRGPAAQAENSRVRKLALPLWFVFIGLTLGEMLQET